MARRGTAARVLVFLALVTAAAPVAWAHKLNVFAWVEASQVKVSAYFRDGAAARGSVTVYGADGRLLLEGKTDSHGEYSFDLPDAAGDLRIVAIAGQAHRNEYTLKSEHVRSGPGAGGPAVSTETDLLDRGATEAPGPGNLDEIRTALARLEAGLHDVQRQLAELRKRDAGPSLERVLAGIGFIVGLTGAAMYFMARNLAKRQRPTARGLREIAESGLVMMGLLEPFAVGTSIFHRLDARAKLVAAMLYSIVVAVVTDFRVLAAGLGFSAALLVAARLKAARLAHRLLVVNAFVAFLWLFLPWSVAGTAVATWGPVTVTHEGLQLALRLTLRCNAIVWASIALLGTSRTIDLARALRDFRLPAKFVLMFHFCVHYVQIIYGEYRRLVDAARIRGFKPGGNLHTYRTYANLAGTLLVRCHDRGVRVYEAMLCRGFNGRFPGLAERRLPVRDVLAAAVIIIYTLLLVGIEWTLTAR